MQRRRDAEEGCRGEPKRNERKKTGRGGGENAIKII